MCEFCGEKGQTYSFIQRGAPGGLVTPFMRQIFQAMFQPYHCPVCGRRLQPHELNGNTTRSLCHGCYNNYIASHVSLDCMICGNPLPHDKVIAQQQNTREVRAKIHEGACIARWVALHNVAHGEQDVIELLRQNMHLLNPRHTGYALPEPDYDDGLGCQEGNILRIPQRARQRVPQGRIQQERRRLPLPVVNRALPSPESQEYVPQQQVRQEEPEYVDVDFYDWNRHR